jgi:hypothetical protein
VLTVIPSDSFSGLRRTSSSEEYAEIKSLQLGIIPPELNNRDGLCDLFAPFGNVVRVQAFPHKNLAYVHFDSHVSIDNPCFPITLPVIASL